MGRARARGDTAGHGQNDHPRIRHSPAGSRRLSAADTSRLHAVLRTVVRRYRLPEQAPADGADASPATALARALEAVRRAQAGDTEPDGAVRSAFLEALDALIREALHPGRGDPVFQAALLQHRAPPVQEHVSLSASAQADRQRVRSIVDAIAHPAKRQALAHPGLAEALAQLYGMASDGAWAGLAQAAQRLRAAPLLAGGPPIEHDLKRLTDSPELARLQRLAALDAHGLVQQHQALWTQHGPRAGSAEARTRGEADQQRGAVVEGRAAQAIEALADRLHGDGHAHHRVVTSLRVPASVLAGAERAKSEWDVALLRQVSDHGATPAWDLCLLVEAKASVDATTTDLPRLMRGLAVLGQARDEAVYPFATRQGVVPLRGASLRALADSAADPHGPVLYVTDALADAAPRLLGADTRLQLLNAPASLAHAGALADGQTSDAGALESLWSALLSAPRWHGVLQQYPRLREARERLVHVADLQAAIDALGRDSAPT